jgi:hypothetical protein
MQIIPNWIGLSRETFVTHTFPPCQKNRVAFDFYLCAFSLTIYIKIFYNDNLFQSRLARILWDPARNSSHRLSSGTHVRQVSSSSHNLIRRISPHFSRRLSGSLGPKASQTSSKSLRRTWQCGTSLICWDDDEKWLSSILLYLTKQETCPSFFFYVPPSLFST